jgi:hypothetical protein
MESEDQSGQTYTAFRSTQSKDPLEISHRGGSDYGHGLYFALDEHDTKPFGPNPKKYTVTLRNPIHVREQEDPALFEKMRRAMKIDDEYFSAVPKNWESLMELVSIGVQMGEYAWSKIMSYLQRLGYDGIYVHNPPRAKGDYIAVFDRAQAVPVVTKVTQELFKPMGHAAMVRPDTRAQSSQWSTGNVHGINTGSIDPPPSEVMATKLEDRLGYIVKGVIGGLLRK